MDQKTLTALERKDLRKGPTGRLRKTGMIPAVIYGHHDPVSISVNAHEFYSQFRTISENTIINLTVDKQKFDVLVKDYQEDAVSQTITHIDFYAIDQNKTLKTNVPVNLTGAAVGVKEGGLLEHLLHALEVECLPKDLPDEFVLDITELEVSHSLHVRDIDVPEGVRIMNSLDQTIVLIQHARVVEEEEEEVEEGLEEGEEAEASEEEESESEE
jgi:large subunit ribosomal protein L25